MSNQQGMAFALILSAIYLAPSLSKGFREAVAMVWFVLAVIVGALGILF